MEILITKQNITTNFYSIKRQKKNNTAHSDFWEDSDTDLLPPNEPSEQEVSWILRNNGERYEKAQLLDWNMHWGRQCCIWGWSLEKKQSVGLWEDSFKRAVWVQLVPLISMPGTLNACHFTTGLGSSAGADRCPPDYRASQKQCLGWESKKHREGLTNLWHWLPHQPYSKSPRLRLIDFHLEKVPYSNAFCPEDSVESCNH